MARYLLNTLKFEEDFFEDSRLFAVGSAWPAYRFCWLLNRMFALDMTRVPDLDIHLAAMDKPVPVKGGQLFDEWSSETRGSAHQGNYFEVFRHEFPYHEGALFLYNNRSEGKRLVPEVKHADYLLLMQYVSYVEPENDLFRHLNKIEAIQWQTELDPGRLKSRNNLII